MQRESVSEVAVRLRRTADAFFHRAGRLEVEGRHLEASHEFVCGLRAQETLGRVLTPSVACSEPSARA